ncbi:hypothetical protein LPJ72_001201 [Coemansia sp. Benny D160-2]|nr:hypothetical protein LPJ72_001201 [Coemansia sp. Benny D160-2]
MLSNGISSRLRQLQRSRTAAEADIDDPPPPSPLPPSSSNAPEFPARKGLAADLINKFNQMSASPAAAPAPAAVVRAPSNGSPAFRSQPLPLPLSLKRTGASTRASANSCGRLLCAASASDTANSSSESLPLPQRPSPFLTDDELHHALSEILQFSRDMNISLFDDDSSSARQA